MARIKSIVSLKFPYLPIKVVIAKGTFKLNALLDTGYDGGVVLSPNLVTNGKPSEWIVDCQLADDSIIQAPAYLGSVTLGSKKLDNIAVLIMGDEPMIGQQVIKHFKVTLDHGQKVIVEP